MVKMKKETNFSFLIIVAVLLLAVGCKTTNTSTTGPFTGGVAAVSIEFNNLAPPTKMDQGKDTPIRVTLRNKGEYDLIEGKAKVKIYGINLADFGLTAGYKGTPGKLGGIGEFTQEGGRQEIDFGKMNYKPSVVNSQDFDVFAKLCYPYQTKALVDVCMKSTISEEAGESEVCSLTGEKVKSGQVSAAPIQVTSLTQSTRGSNQVRFDMTIENKGTGNVFLASSDCAALDDEMKRLDSKDKVNVEILKPLGVQCRFVSGDDTNKGVISLENGVGELSCWKDVEETFKDQIGIMLSYVYTDTTSKTITVYEKVAAR